MRLWGGSLLLAHQGKAATLFGEIGFAATRGRDPLFLFGERRRDRRWDLSAGAIFTKAKLGASCRRARDSHRQPRRHRAVDIAGPASTSASRTF